MQSVASHFCRNLIAFDKCVPKWDLDFSSSFVPYFLLGSSAHPVYKTSIMKQLPRLNINNTADDDNHNVDDDDDDEA